MRRRPLLRIIPLLVVSMAAAVVPALDATAATTTRIAGKDRYETSALISASAVPPGRSVVYVASGTDFPDALAAAPVAGTRDTSVLLVTRDSVPDSVKAELTRIKAPTIHVIGGKASVSDAVMTELEKYATNVDRIAGDSRYDTAAAISRSFFQPNLAYVYIVTGESFPDALAAGAAAVDRGAVLLVTHDAVPPATVTELKHLTPQEIIVVGGTGAVSDNVKDALDEYTTGPVTRQAGADRYATSAAVSKAAFQAPTDAVYLASGATFADAVSGGAIAGANDGPVVLVKRDCTTTEVLAEMSRLEPDRHVIFGGTAAVANGADTAACGATSTNVIATGLQIPWDVAFVPDGTVYVDQRGGALLRRLPGQTTFDAFQQIDGVVADGGEGGLLGLAYRDGLLYAFMTTANDNRIVRFTPGAAPTAILTGIAKSHFHNAGRIAFGPDGLLYAGTGDGETPSRAQDPASLNGKILRIRADGTIPPGNLSPSSPVYALGFRDPQGLAWDATGRMYASEFGPDRDDEINIITAGANYGWNGTRTGVVDEPGFVDPIIVRQPPVASWSGAAIVHGGVTEWDGDLLVAALRGTRLYRFDLGADGRPIGSGEELFTGTYGRLRHVEQAPDGSVWILTSNHDANGTPGPDDDRIIRIAKTG
jgi:glucose/arabinose dehydrogenase